jgi:folate-binding protein YgfZ
MAKQSTLAEFHKRQGAVFAESEGWLLPTHFGDAAAEYNAVRSAVGLMDLPNHALLQFTGADRLSFLQGMLSNDLRPLKMFDGQRAALLTQQGKIIAEVRVLCSMNSFYLDFWEPLKERILAHLHRYLVADEVEIVDPSDDWKILSLQGPHARNLLDELFGQAELPAQPNQHAMVQFNGSPICVVRANHFGESGYDLIVAANAIAHIAQCLTETGKTFAARWVGAQAQDILRIEAGVPRHGIDFNEDTLLLEVGLENAVSFTKGCYLGQEVVERIRSRGHVNKKLSGLLLDGNQPASPGESILAGDKEVGKITSSADSPALQRPIALGYVQKDFWSPGTALAVLSQGRQIAAQVTALPFIGTASSSS